LVNDVDVFAMKTIHLLFVLGMALVAPMSASLGQDAPEQSASEPPAPAKSKPKPPAPPLVQCVVELDGVTPAPASAGFDAPKAMPAPRLVIRSQTTSQYTQPILRRQLQEVSEKDFNTLLKTPTPGTQVFSMGGKYYVLKKSGNVEMTLSVEGDHSIDIRVGTALPQNGVPSGTGMDVQRTELHNTAAEWPKGMAVGNVTVKITSTTAPAYLPEIQQVWYVLAGRDGSPNDAAPAVPPAVLQQATDVLGFTPVVLDAQQATFSDNNTSNSTWTKVLYKPTVESKEDFEVNLQVSAPTPDKTFGGYSSVFRLSGIGWVGAPVFAGPISAGPEEIYVLLIAQAKPDPARAQKILAAPRTWTAAGGHTTMAQFVKEENGKVTLRKTDGTEVTVPVAVLSAEDRALLEEARAPAAAPPAADAPAAGTP
jgi:hypothetical protein